MPGFFLLNCPHESEESGIKRPLEIHARVDSE
jgi:hypothetical protein